MKRWFVFLVMILAVIAGLWWRQQREVGAATAVSASVTSYLSGEADAAFARATEPGAIRFPRDLAAHDEYQTEWWYYTGNLQTADGREFGYQFTIFRRALIPEIGDWRLEIEASEQSPTSNPQSPSSNWRTNQVYFAHFTVSDIANRQFYQHEKLSRGSTGLAGAQAEPYRVWIEVWSAMETAPGVVRLRAQSEDVTIDLQLRQTLPPILHGDAGLSQKGPEAGNASYYYSFVQQPTEGTVQIGNQTFTVSGVSWKDHEYGTSALTRAAVGWDWFSAQLDNGAALMVGQIREADGRASPYSIGTWIAADGETTVLSAADMNLTVSDTWRSPTTGITYPAGWRLEIPKVGLVLTAVPLMPNQELTLNTTYWEGAIAYSGIVNGEPISGRGYVELTGYNQ
ncbi:MAG TPA: lipocalin-like domain-containing protein [Chloroflexota bacterium]|nr:lipocalin-like domain-containing protein [Chloroflexota bacterium]HUM71442.1 lipocalin-like domain-containing protein [Chloroflexota bacterium]